MRSQDWCFKTLLIFFPVVLVGLRIVQKLIFSHSEGDHQKYLFTCPKQGCPCYCFFYFFRNFLMQRQWRVKNAGEVCISDSAKILAKRNTTVERETAVLETTVEKFHPPWRSGSDLLAPGAGVLDAGATHPLNQPAVIQNFWGLEINWSNEGGGVMGVPPSFVHPSCQKTNK